MDKKVLFFGSDDIALIALTSLMQIKANIVGVVTVPDKPQGRKKEIIFNEIKSYAIKNNLKLFQPAKLSLEANDILNQTKPDIIITCSYGKIIPEVILNYPKYKCINIHPSLLPKYRGAIPMQAAIMNNDDVTGVSFVYMVKALDAGDIIFQEKINLNKDETTKSLKIKVKQKISEMIIKYFDDLFNLNIKSTKQDESKASYVSQIESKDEIINWNQPAKQIDGLVRALYDKPYARTVLENKNIKVIHTLVTNTNSSNFKPGEIIKTDNTGILVATKDLAILIDQIQIEGKKPQFVKAIINGHHPFQAHKIFK